MLCVRCKFLHCRKSTRINSPLNSSLYKFQIKSLSTFSHNYLKNIRMMYILGIHIEVQIWFFHKCMLNIIHSAALMLLYFSLDILSLCLCPSTQKYASSALHSEFMFWHKTCQPNLFANNRIQVTRIVVLFLDKNCLMYQQKRLMHLCNQITSVSVSSWQMSTIDICHRRSEAKLVCALADHMPQTCFLVILLFWSRCYWNN